MLVEVSDIEARLPRPLELDEQRRLGVLLSDAEDLIASEFQREGRDFNAELDTVPWLPSTAVRVIRSMVSAAILVGVNAGIRSVSSASGPTNDSITFADVNAVDWGGVTLTAEHRVALGLSVGCVPSGVFPAPPIWPEEVLQRGKRAR